LAVTGAAIGKLACRTSLQLLFHLLTTTKASRKNTVISKETTFLFQYLLEIWEHHDRIRIFLPDSCGKVHELVAFGVKETHCVIWLETIPFKE